MFTRRGLCRVGRIFVRLAMSIPAGSGSQPGNGERKPPLSRRIALHASISDEVVFEIDITGLQNANAAWPLVAFVEEQCSLGKWHRDSEGWFLPLWSD